MLRQWLARLMVGLLPAVAVALVLTVHCRVEARDFQSDQGAPVIFDGQALFSLPGKVGQYTAEERSLLIEKQLISLAEARQIPIASIRVVHLAAQSDIVVGDVRLLTITDEDAALTGGNRPDVVRDDATRIRQAISQFRDKWSPKRRLLGGLYAILTTVLLVLVISALRRLRRKLWERIEHSGKSPIAHHKIQAQELIASTQYKSFLTALVGIGYWALFLVLLAIFIPVLMSFFPRTVGYVASLSEWFFSPLRDFSAGFASQLPDLFFVAVICFVINMVLKLSTFFFAAIQSGKIAIEGFYPDWAGTTSLLVRMFIFALGAIIIYPYLPGSKWPAFQGISVFLGFLLSLGSSSLVANRVAAQKVEGT